MTKLSDRFWSKVDIQSEDECWNWTATKTAFGYGSFRIGSMKDGTRRKEMAHRVSYMLANGSYPEKGLLVTHSCDNPACVNPKHLSKGTYSSNGKESYARKRRWNQLHGGVKHIRCNFSELSIQRIKIVGKSIRASVLAEMFGVGKTTISAIISGQNFGRLCTKQALA